MHEHGVGFSRASAELAFKSISPGEANNDCTSQVWGQSDPRFTRKFEENMKQINQSDAKTGRRIGGIWQKMIRPVESTVSEHIKFEVYHDDVIKWKLFRVAGPLCGSPVNPPHKGQWRGALIFSLICAWINGWVNNREAGDLRRHLAHYDVIVMTTNGSCANAQKPTTCGGRPEGWLWWRQKNAEILDFSILKISKCAQQ